MSVFSFEQYTIEVNLYDILRLTDVEAAGFDVVMISYAMVKQKPTKVSFGKFQTPKGLVKYYLLRYGWRSL